VTDVQVEAGKGISGTVDGHHVAVGSARYVSELMQAPPPPLALPEDQQQQVYNNAIDRIQSAATTWGAQGATTAFVLVDRKSAGVIAMRDVPRASAAAAVAQLRARGVVCAMLTGEYSSEAGREE
jgi:cation transport ATPase